MITSTTVSTSACRQTHTHTRFSVQHHLQVIEGITCNVTFQRFMKSDDESRIQASPEHSDGYGQAINH